MKLSTLAAGLLSLAVAAGCSSSDSNTPSGTGGSTGSGGSSASGGSSGSGGSSASGGSSGSGGSGADAGGTAFTAVEPCAAATDYVEGTSISFVPAEIKYTPKCLKVKAGASVKFAGNFAGHPISPSKRGDQTDNPIKETTTGTDASFTFAKPGFFAFYCKFHGFQDDGKNMAGVVWVTP